MVPTELFFESFIKVYKENAFVRVRLKRWLIFIVHHIKTKETFNRNFNMKRLLQILITHANTSVLTLHGR